MRFGLNVLGLTLLLCHSALNADIPPSMVDSMTSQQMIEAGRIGFVNRCSGCHGVAADGNGEAALMLNPKPRNLVAGAFKFRSTPGGVLPTVHDLMRTINQGVIGTAMPPFREVAEQEKLAIVAYIMSLRPDFNETKKDRVSVNLPNPPKLVFENKASLLKAALRGKALYQTACLSCHGANGQGDGLAAADLTDSDNQPIKPANLQKSFIKSGHTVRDIFKAITTGLDGTPMPAYGDMFDEAKRWDIVAYVFYLRGLGNGIYTEKDELK